MNVDDNINEKNKRINLIRNRIGYVKNSTSYRDFSYDELNQIHDIFDNQDFISVGEAGLYYRKSVPTIYRMIKDGRIVARRANALDNYMIDVKATNKNLRIGA